MDSDTGCSAHLVDLGQSCLYFGGGKATVVPPGPVPDGSDYLFTVPAAGTIAGNPGTGPSNCTLGEGPGKHCINGFCNSDADCGGVSGSCNSNRCDPGTQTTPLSCTTDVNCGGCAGCCGLDANCFFGPPLPISSPPPNDALTTCVVNVIQTTAYGTFDAPTGTATIGMPLGSRVFITGNSASPCPKCLAGTCDASWNDVNAAPGEDNGKSCVEYGSVGTTLDCRPPLSGFQAELPIDYGTTPLTTGASSKTAADGRMCASAGQSVANAGAFGQPTAKCIKEAGSPAGDITDNAPHAAVIATVFCVPKTGNVAVDGVAALPGPGAVAINGAMTLQ